MKLRPTTWTNWTKTRTNLTTTNWRRWKKNVDALDDDEAESRRPMPSRSALPTRACPDSHGLTAATIAAGDRRRRRRR